MNRIIKNYSCQIKYFLLPHSGSPASARNKGIMEASGEYIAFLDSDDLMTKDRLVKQIKILNENTQIDVLCGNAQKFTNKKKLGPYFINSQSENISFASLLNSNLIIQSTVMMRSNLSISEFQFPEIKFVHEDYGYWLKISATDKKIYYSSEVFIKYRINPNGISRKLTPLKSIQKSINTLKWLVQEKNINNNKKIIIKKKIKKLKKEKMIKMIKNIIKLFNK